MSMLFSIYLIVGICVALALFIFDRVEVRPVAALAFSATIIGAWPILLAAVIWRFVEEKRIKRKYILVPPGEMETDKLIQRWERGDSSPALLAELGKRFNNGKPVERKPDPLRALR